MCNTTYVHVHVHVRILHVLKDREILFVLFCCCLPQSNAEREWLLRRYEEQRHSDFGAERKKTMAEQLVKCQTFDRFLAKKFGTVKRYGAEGAESMITFFDEVLSKCGKGNNIIIGLRSMDRLRL